MKEKKHERKDLVSHNHKNSGQEVPRSAFMSFRAFVCSCGAHNIQQTHTPHHHRAKYIYIYGNVFEGAQMIFNRNAASIASQRASNLFKPIKYAKTRIHLAIS